MASFYARAADPTNAAESASECILSYLNSGEPRLNARPGQA